MKVWERAHKLTIAIYLLTKNFPKDELYGLTSQLRRSCSSIPTNIAEGCGKASQSELKRFLQIAMGSSSELDYLLMLAHELSYIDDNVYLETFNELIELRRMLNAFIQKIKGDSSVQYAKSKLLNANRQGWFYDP